MALPGMRSTADFATDERPKNWREGVLLLEPRNNAPLAALTAAMPSDSTFDPEFNWWEEALDVGQLTLNDGTGMTDADTTFTVDEYGTRLKAGDLLMVVRTRETIRVTSVTSDTEFAAARGISGTTAAALLDNDVLVLIGSAYREGAGRPTGVSWNPTKQYNYTQIFRDSVEWTRTASATRLRTGDMMKNDRRRALNKHMIGMERAFMFGTRFETTESGQPLRFTGGVLNRIAAANVQTVSGGELTMAELEDYMVSAFAYGSGEKLVFGGLGTMSLINRLVRKNSQYQWGPADTEFKMNVRRLTTGAGTLILTEHPLYSKPGAPLANDLVILDTANLRYRYLDGADTKLLKDREDRGTDGKAEEYLTECGIEVRHPETHFWLKGITSVAEDA